MKSLMPDNCDFFVVKDDTSRIFIGMDYSMTAQPEVIVEVYNHVFVAK